MTKKMVLALWIVLCASIAVTASPKSDERCPIIPFLALTGRPTEQDVVRKVEALHRDGLDAVLLYGRSGLEYEYLGEDWMKMCETFCREAERRGMKVWLYDEFCWPSGSCNGRILKEKLDWCLNQWGVFRDASGKLTWERAYSKEVMNVYEREATDRFVELTHEVYYQRLRPYFDRKVIVGIFTDEPGTPLGIEFKGKPVVRFEAWNGMEAEYAAETGGRRLKDDVEAYVNDNSKDEVWAAYSRIKGRRFRACYYRPINAWCQKAGIHSTGHLTEELSMVGGPIAQGDLLHVMKGETLPGMDEIFTNTEKGNIEWITFGTAQHASLRSAGGPAALVELFAIGPNDMSFAKMRQMIWLEALHNVDTYLCSMEVMDHRGLIAKHGYLSPVQEGQPWHRHMKPLLDEARKAARFARRSDFRCEIAIRYPQDDAARFAYRRTGGTFPWSDMTGPALAALIADIRGRQLDYDLIEQDEKTDRRFVFRVVDGGYIEERTGERFTTARAAADRMLEMIRSRIRVLEADGKVADSLVTREYADGSVVLLNIQAGAPRRLVAVSGASRVPFVLPERGILTLGADELPRSPTPETVWPLGVSEFELSLDRDNLQRLVFGSQEEVRFTVGKDTPPIHFVVRDWPEQAQLLLDGRPIVAARPCMTLPVEYRPLYRETEPQTLTSGEHVLKLSAGGNDLNYFLPVVLAAGKFGAWKDAHGVVGFAQPLKRLAPGSLDASGFGGFVGELTYRTKVVPPKGEGQLTLRLPTSSVVVRASWNGKDLGVCAWAPYEWKLPADAAGKSGVLELVVPTTVAQMFGDPQGVAWHGLWRSPRDRPSEGLAIAPVWVFGKASSKAHDSADAAPRR